MGDITSTLVTTDGCLEGIMQLQVSLQRWECKYSTIISSSESDSYMSFPVTLSPWASNNESDCLSHRSVSSNSSLFSSALTVLSCLRSLQIARQMSSFTSTLPSGWASTTSLCGFGFCIHSRGRGGRVGSSYGCEINKTCHVYKQRWAQRLFLPLCCDLLVPVQPWMALCARAGTGGEGLGRATKRRLLWI